MHSSLKIFGLCAGVFMLTACSSGMKSSSEKIAVIKWEKAVESHPDYGRLQQGEKVIKNLVLRRDAQAELGKSQMGNLQHLRSLKQLSEQSYLQAELQTQLVEKEQLGKSRLFLKSKVIEKEAERLFAQKRQAVEDEYRLRIFNLRLEKDRAVANARPSQAEKLEVTLAGIENKINILVQERESKLVSVELDKQAYVSEKLAPEVSALRKELAEFSAAKKIENQAIVEASEGKYDKMMAAAPEALANALAVMDREIDKQQDKNNTLKKNINSDIEGLAIKLAKERGYTIVFNTYKANVSAEDITNDIIINLKKIKNK